MTRYIDAELLKEDLRYSEERLRELYKGLKYDEDKQICAGQITTFVECILRIKEAPTADVAEVKHGEWLWDTEDIYECSNCHIETRVDEVMGMPTYKYCPFCGTKMDGERKTE